MVWIKLPRLTTNPMSAIFRVLLFLFATSNFLQLTTLAQPEPIELEKMPSFPPPHPPSLEQGPGNLAWQKLSIESTLYSIGEPSPEEQLYLELINRARANPTQEGILLSQTTDPSILGAYSYYSVDLNLMKDQFASIQPAPPLAMNAKLTAAARRHSQDMLDHAYQGHTGSDGSTAGTRVTDAGYDYSNVGENVYASAESVPFGHAGFEVDWGPGTGGMQTPPGHRNNIHNPVYREAGIGVVLGNNSSGTSQVGPQLVTQELGLQQNATPYLTGVAYYDLNGNHFYDIGEGIGGVSVTVENEPYSAVTTKSGGYAVPVSANSSYEVVFAAPGFTPKTNQISQALDNIKLDFTPEYHPPAITGPAKPATNTANHYTIFAVGGARQYEWRQFQTISPRQEGAENGADNVILVTAGSYEVFATDVYKSGVHSFHLVHPVPAAQSITLKPSYIPATNGSSISFQSRLGYAGEAQIARVQISTDSGVNWTTIYSQVGSGGSGEPVFTLKTVPLTAYAGQTIKVRFVYDFTSGQYYYQTSPGAGWYIDDIQFSNTSEITNEQTASTTNPSFDFNPSTIANYGLQARALTGHDFLPWGPITYVQGATAPPELKLTGISRVENGTFELTFDLISGTAPASFSIQKKRALDEPWGTPTAIPVETISPGKYKLNAAGLARSTIGFFRIVGS